MEKLQKQNDRASIGTRLKDRYLSFFNKHKSAAFIKNQAASGMLFVVGGVATAKVTSMMTSSKALIAGCSTAGEYVVGVPAFFALHYMDNRDLYKDGDRIRWKRAWIDFAKIMAGTALLDAAYLVARPVLHYHFMKNGTDATAASVYADLIAGPCYWVAALYWAKWTGVLTPDAEKKADVRASNSPCA